MNIHEASEQWLAAMAARKRSPATVANYRYALEALSAYVGADKPTTSLSHITFRHFTDHVLKRNYAASTAGIYASALSGWVRFIIRNDLVQWSPADTLKVEDLLVSLRPRRAKVLPRVPQAEAVQAIVEMAYQSPLPSPVKERNAAIVELMVCTGCRIHELVGLKVRDLDLKAREAIIMGKGRKERKVFLSPSAVVSCNKYWRARKNIGPDTPALARHDTAAGKTLKPIGTAGMRRVVNALASLAGVEHFTPHKFRHAFATRMLEETSDLAMVQDALGHSSPETTRIYAQVNPQALKRAHQEVFKR